MNFKPMLSASLDNVDLATLRYPLLLSPKLDGFRCIVWEGVAYSRNAKPIRNAFIQKWAKDFHNIDGELIVGSPTDANCFGATSSGVTSADGEPDFRFHLFDCVKETQFGRRLDHVQREHMECPRIECVPHKVVNHEGELLWHEKQFLEQGYEGIMLRDPKGPYKSGRSTLREGYLMKLKRFMDGEAVVVRLEQGRTNNNEAFKDELGRTKRQTLAENMAGNGMIGTLICKDPKWGEIRVAPGKMTHDDRMWYWNNQDLMRNKAIHWRSFGYGTKDAPRHARFYGIVEGV